MAFANDFPNECAYKKRAITSHHVRGIADGKIAAGYSFRYSITREVSALHNCGGGYTRIGDRGQYRDVQRNSLCSAECLARSGFQSSAGCVATPGEWKQQSLLHAGFSGLEAARRPIGSNGRACFLAI